MNSGRMVDGQFQKYDLGTRLNAGFQVGAGAITIGTGDSDLGRSVFIAGSLWNTGRTIQQVVPQAIQAVQNMAHTASKVILDAYNEASQMLNPVIPTSYNEAVGGQRPTDPWNSNLDRYGAYLNIEMAMPNASDSIYGSGGNAASQGYNPGNSDGPSGFWGTAWYYAKATGMGLVQGGANIVNGLQDTVIGIANLPAMGVNSIAWMEEKVGILPENSMRMPYIPSPDWSRDIASKESGTGWADTHNWSKGLGAGGVEILTGAWWGRASKARQAAGLVDDAATRTAQTITKSSRQRLKRTINNLSHPENPGLSQQKLDQLRRISGKAKAKVRVDLDGVKGTGVRPHSHVEGLGSKVESRHIWLQEGVR